jgi:tetratricopeptide (TPR) repeat protein
MWRFACLVFMLLLFPKAAATAQDCPGSVSYDDAYHSLVLENYEYALRLANCLIAQEPSVGRNYHVRGSVLMHQGEYAAAREDFERVIALDDMACPCGLRSMGALYALIGDYPAAVNYFQQALDKAEIARDFYYAWLAYGYIKLGDEAAALATYDAGLEESGQHYSLYLARGGYWQSIGEGQRAAEDYIRYTEAQAVSKSREELRLNDLRSTTWGSGETHYRRFSGQQGQTFIAHAFAHPDDDPIDPLLVLLGPDEEPLWGSNNLVWEVDEPDELQALIEFVLPETGDYYLVVTHGTYYPRINGAIRTISWLINPEDLLKLDDIVLITSGSVPLRVREEPSLSAEQVGTFREGMQALVLAGPVYADGYRWWRLRGDDNSIGWSAEFVDGERQFDRPGP